MYRHRSVSLNNEKICCEISEDKIAFCEKTAGLRSGNFSDLKNTTTLYHRIIGSNWNRKLVPKAHARFQFCFDPVRSNAYFPEWKAAFSIAKVVAAIVNFLTQGLRSKRRTCRLIF